MVDIDVNLKQLLSLYSNGELSDEQLSKFVPNFSVEEKDELIVSRAIAERKEEEEYSAGEYDDGNDGSDDTREEQLF